MALTRKQKAAVAATALAAGAYFLPTAAPQPPVTYAVVRWTVRSNGVLIAGVPSVVSYSTNLRDWQRIATNSTGQITVATDAAANFFKVQPL